MILSVSFVPRPTLPPAPTPPTPPVPMPLILPGGCYPPAPIKILPIPEGWTR